MRCTFAIRQLAYDTVHDAFDEYLQMVQATVVSALKNFRSSVMENFGAEYLRKLIVTNVEKIYAFHERKHWFPGMLGSLDLHIGSGFVVLEHIKGNFVDVIMIPFVANDIPYPWGYYLVDGIFLEWATLVETISNVSEDDHK
ncbi:nucleotide-binding alpha-beta plait domain-containing protein [Tanacetum coccineum]